MIALRSSCKINLGLRILGLRQDGCHELASLFYPLSWPADHLLITEGDAPGLSLECGAKSIPPEKNLVFLAYKAYAKAAGFAPAIHCRLVKRTPMGAGLGGGSANAARFLLWLNEIAPKPMAKTELAELAASLGADVPFFLANRPCLATGKGENLRPIRFSGLNHTLLLVMPQIFISTPAAFTAWDALNPHMHYLTSAGNMGKNFCSDCFSVMDTDCSNDLEQAVYQMAPELAGLKEFLTSRGAIKAAMSGSGSAHYGIFPNRSQALKSAALLRKQGYFAACMPMPDFGM